MTYTQQTEGPTNVTSTAFSVTTLSTPFVSIWSPNIGGEGAYSEICRKYRLVSGQWSLQIYTGFVALK